MRPFRARRGGSDRLRAGHECLSRLHRGPLAQPLERIMLRVPDHMDRNLAMPTGRDGSTWVTAHQTLLRDRIHFEPVVVEPMELIAIDAPERHARAKEGFR